MSSKLKDFIDSNKEEFNRLQPSSNLWGRIEAELDSADLVDAKQTKVKKLWWSPWMSIAALLLVVFTVAITIGVRNNFYGDESGQQAGSFKDQQIHFTSLIEEKRDSLQIYSSTNPQLYQEFVRDLKQLDEDYVKLQEQLKTSPNQEVVVQAMIKNLEIRANMLSQQLQIFNHVREVKEEKVL